MPGRRRRFDVLLAAVAGLALVASTMVAAPAGAGPLAPADPPVPEIPQRFLDQQLSWETCPGALDAKVKKIYPDAPTTRCARVSVPMDWNHPDDHPEISVAVAYSQASGESKGLMMMNPGGPGPGLDFPATTAADKTRLFTDYDLVGFDQRGFGSSRPRLECRTTAQEIQALPSTPDHRERTARTHAAEVATAKLLAKACSATELGEFVSTQQTVYDMELIRALLAGEDRLSYIGYSYGSWLGGWYADTYPDRVGRFVLDSSMDITRTQWDNLNFDPFSGQRRRDTQLFAWLARNAHLVDGLGETPSSVLSSYERIRAGLTELVKAGRSTVRADTFDARIYSTLASNVRFVRGTLDILVHDEYVKAPSPNGRVTVQHVDRAWARIAPELRAYDTLADIRTRYGVAAPAVAAAVAVDAPITATTLVERADAIAADERGDQVVNIGSDPITVRCNDTRWRSGADYYLKQADLMTARYPFFGYMNGVPPCAFWPYEPQHRTVDLEGSPRVLMVHAELDPITAFEGADRTRRTLPEQNRFVAVDNEGQHGQYLLGPSECVEAIADRFVFGGRLVRSDKVCWTAPLPAESAVFSVRGPVDGDSVPLPDRRRSAEQCNPLLQKVLDRVAANQR